MLQQADKNQILAAAKEGDINTIQQYSSQTIQQTTDSSGCTPLHWAAGSNHLPLLQYLLNPNPTPIFQPNHAVASRKAKGRTALHYACRNGHLDIVKVLLLQYNADPRARAKHGVTPFQLAVWQNHLPICQYLTREIGIEPKLEVNDFGCGILHWMGICPLKRADHIVDMAKWIMEHEGMDVCKVQNQGRTVLHKASWGGHFELVRYLHSVHGMYDDTKDHAGNYAADLADMANTDRHLNIANYLRRDCSLEYRKSCQALGLDREIMLGMERNIAQDLIRKAYLDKAKGSHPDKRRGDESSREEFQAVKKAYDHLMKGGVDKKQKNPMHSIHMMLEIQKQAETRHSHQNQQDNNNNQDCKTDIDEENESNDLKFFKPRLIAVLLEYGEKGIHLSNIPKVWEKVWPNDAFPLIPISSSTCNNDSGASKKQQASSKRRRKKGELLRLIESRCGDVITVIRDTDTGILIKPRNVFRKDVAQCVTEMGAISISVESS